MQKSVLCLSLLASLSFPLFASGVQAAGSVGFRNIEVPDAGGDRPLKVSIWYPATDTGPLVQVGENRVFYGTPAVADATLAGDKHPLVVLSHGYGGSWRNLNWLATVLVGQGYVVAAPDHPGTTTFDRSPAQAQRLDARPRDLSRVIDALTGDASIAGEIEPARIAAIGHSLGGWTVTALGGARFSTQRFEQDCKVNPNPRTCGLAGELGMAPGPDNPLDGDMRDARVGAIVSLDLGLARGFTPESLAAFEIPALVIGAGVDIGDLPARLESGYLGANLPAATSSYIEIADATHFSFMQPCKPGAIEMIEQETPGDGIVCMNGGTRDRQAIHRELADMITAFLAKALPGAQVRSH